MLMPRDHLRKEVVLDIMIRIGMKVQVETRQVWQDFGSAVFLSRRHTESADDRTCTTTLCDNLCNVVLNEVNSALRTLGRIFETVYSRPLINVTYPCSGRGIQEFNSVSPSSAQGSNVRKWPST